MAGKSSGKGKSKSPWRAMAGEGSIADKGKGKRSISSAGATTYPIGAHYKGKAKGKSAEKGW